MNPADNFAARFPPEAYPFSKNGDSHRSLRGYDKCYKFDTCKKKGESVFRCEPCDKSWCSDCWEEVPDHKSEPAGPRDARRHEQTDPALARTIDDIFSPPTTPYKELQYEEEASFWFGVQNREDSPVLQQGRVFEQLLETSGNSVPGTFPGLVSFVGRTGEGKSTLINLLTELVPKEKRQDGLKPTTRSRKELLWSGTSADNHLFLGPQSRDREITLLYADSEGLTGAGSDPEMAKFPESGDNLQLLRPEPRRIPWANNSDEYDRQFWVEEFYPPILYTFSDVVVYPLSQDTLGIGNSMVEYLIFWASKALERSSNQPVLPYAIAVVNKVDLSLAAPWESDSQIEAMKNEMGRKPGKLLREVAKQWKNKGEKADTLGSLFYRYYSGISVVLIPEKGNSNLLLERITELRGRIEQACQDSMEKKKAEGTRQDARDFTLLIDKAFDHFCLSPGKTFDFVSAWLDIYPIFYTNRLVSGILELALAVQKADGARLQFNALWEEIREFISSCVVLDASRHNDLREDMFDEYRRYCNLAITRFHQDYLPCRSEDLQGSPCVNLRRGHAKGHQTIDGRTYGDESDRKYIPSADPGDRSNVLQSFSPVLRKMWFDKNRCFATHESVVKRFWEAKLKSLETSNSRRICFVCLAGLPDHHLSCSHVVCSACIRDAGKHRGACFYDLERCPLDQQVLDKPVPISIKPPGAGVRILSLDGGGPFGIIELEILRSIENELEEVPLHAFFDLIVGTSAGGIIALAMGILSWTVEKCSNEFPSLWARGVVPYHGASSKIARLLLIATFGSIFSPDALRETLRGVFADRALFGEGYSNESLPTKVAVTAATRDGRAVVFGNYNRLACDKPFYSFPETDIQVRQAAQATAAIPLAFSPVRHEDVTLVDGAIYHNNPVKIASAEWKLIWRDTKHRHPDILLSVGAGYSPPEETREHTSSSRWRPRFWAAARAFGVGYVKNVLSGERIWNEFLAIKAPSDRHSDRYRRLNVPLDDEDYALDIKQSPALIKRLQKLAQEKIDKEMTKKAKITARQLMASSFFLRHAPEGCSFVECRFCPGEEITKKFLRLLYKVLKKEGRDSLEFRYKSLQVSETLKIKLEELSQMANDGHFSRLWEIKIGQDQGCEVSVLLLPGDYEGDKFLPISGFSMRAE